MKQEGPQNEPAADLEMAVVTDLHSTIYRLQITKWPLIAAEVVLQRLQRALGITCSAAFAIFP
jgi:hypothetical protein